MLHNTLPAHLTELSPRLAEHPIVVYQGFSPRFLRKAMGELTSLLPIDQYLSEDQLILPEDEAGRESLQKSLMEALVSHSDKAVAMPFEHYWALRTARGDETAWERPVLIFQNNLTHTYPNFSNLTAPDYAAIIDKGEEPEVNPDFSFFYTNPIHHDKQLLIQYPAWYMDEGVETISYFGELPTPDIEVKEISDLPAGYVSYPGADGSFTNLTIQVQQDSAPDTVNVVIGDSVFDKTAGLDLAPVNILGHLFALGGSNLQLFRLPPAKVQSFRPEVQEVLQQHWGSDSFRSLTFYTNPEQSSETYQISQGEIIEEIIQNAEKSKDGENYQDIFLTAPTGAGKSILFQIPAIYLAKTYNQVSIVISPLIALMNDQVEALHERGVPGATYINSELSPAEVQNRLQAIKDGEISIVYLSPELLLGYDIQYFIGERSLGLFIVDEAHTISTWGKEFRVDYWFLGEYLRKLKRYSGHRFPVVALTATAIYRGPHDMVFETVNTLELNAAKIFIGDVKREQISFNVNPLEIEGPYKKGRLAHTAQRVEEMLQEPKKVLIYFVWVRNLREIHKLISPEARMKVGTYYSGMKSDAKAEAISKFKDGSYQIILATKAFGMGVDISDIEVIYHNAPSSSFTDYVQEIGRAARKKTLTASAGLDFHPRDLSFSRSLFGGSSIKQWQIRATMDKIRDLQGVKQSPNLMLSPDSFTHIFNERSSQDVEQKVKRTLMLIEKDLANMTQRTILRIRPHTVVNEVYARVSKEIQDDFMEKYGVHAEKIESARMQQRTMAGGHHMIMKEKPPVYKLQLARIWENNFPEYTYPQIRYHYGQKRLFDEFSAGEVYPQMELSIELFYEVEEVKQRFESFFNALATALGSFGSKYFTRQTFTKVLNEHMPEEFNLNVSKTANLILSLYSSGGKINRYRKVKWTRPEGGAFLLSEENDAGQAALLFIKKDFDQVRQHLRQRLTTMLREVQEGNYNDFISTSKNKRTLNVCYMIDALQLGAFELVGGDRPLIFVRICDPAFFNQVVDDSRYKNQLAKALQDKFTVTQNMMKDFFSAELETTDRWRYIEDYFLGRMDIPDLDAPKEEAAEAETKA